MKASASTVYTKQETNTNDISYANALNDKADKFNSYTTTEIKAFSETQYTFAAPLQRSVTTTTGIFTLIINPNTSINDSFTEIVNIRTPAQLGGSIRIILALDDNEASIVYYNYNGARWTTTGDAWVCGVKRWDKQGYSNGTPVLNNFQNINLNGHVDLPYGIMTPAITVDSIRAYVAEQLTINDNEISTGDTTIGGKCNMSNNLLALGNREFGKTMSIKTQSQNGDIYELNRLCMVTNHLLYNITVLIYVIL